MSSHHVMLYLKNLLILGFSIQLFYSCTKPVKDSSPKLPNILFAISDDQSFPYATAYGIQTARTPAFDRVAKQGVLFNNAFCAAPQCSPSRAAILTGKNIWELEEAGTHSSYFPKKFPVFTDALEAKGYELGYTGKAWGPGNWKDMGWERNPVGPAFNEYVYDTVPYSGINKRNYSKNFEAFLKQKESGKPFFFWFGCHEPHRVYEQGSGVKEGKQLAEAFVPNFLPDIPLTQGDVLDYATEIQWFDKHLGEMLELLEQRGELDNTIVIITADNGMPFPYAKANLQEYGIHVPLAFMGPNISGDRKVDELVSLIDLAPTLLELTGTPSLPKITGQSFAKLLTEDESYAGREYVLIGRERHTHARPDNLGYPARAIRSKDFLYIHNFKPDRWPAGDPEVDLKEIEKNDPTFKSMTEGYHDIDPCPSKTLLLENREKYDQFFQLATSKRPMEELFDIVADPACTLNLAQSPEYQEIKLQLQQELMRRLNQQQDPRVLGQGDIFDSYPRFAKMRNFPGFKERGAYNPAFQAPKANP